VTDEARLEQLLGGLTPVTDGWFVVNVPDAAWVTNDVLGDACIIEGDDVSFPQLGFTIAVLQPGQAGGRYHHEANQEDFLVLAGTCLLLIEGEERRLETWDFVHCPPGTEHAFVGAGDGPCVMVTVGARTEGGTILYARDETALRHDAGVEAETDTPAEAYGPFPKWESGRPAGWDSLPWVRRASRP
jgi:uncharacterized cupin superfamily protein